MANDRINSNILDVNNINLRRMIVKSIDDAFITRHFASLVKIVIGRFSVIPDIY